MSIAEVQNTSGAYPLDCLTTKAPWHRLHPVPGLDLREQADMPDATCSIAGCPGKVNARGWCGGHYARWRKTGDVQPDVPLDARLTKGTPCAVDECPNPQLARGWCNRHYTLWRLHGSTEDRPRGGVKPRKGIYPPGSKVPHEWVTCASCGTRALVRMGGKGYCSRICAKVAMRGEAHPNWMGPQGSYKAQHDRVKRARGKADHCSQCDRSDDGVVYQWANLTGNYDDVADFAAMCPACHAVYDAPLKARGSAIRTAKLTEQIVLEARMRRADGERVALMAAEYGVTEECLRNAITRRTWKHVA